MAKFGVLLSAAGGIPSVRGRERGKPRGSGRPSKGTANAKLYPDAYPLPTQDEKL